MRADGLILTRVHDGDGPVAARPGWPEIARVRATVFIEGQACPAEEEFDGLDDAAVQVLARWGAEAVGTFRWRRIVGEAGEVAAKLERFAVLEPFRGRGIGRALVEAAIADVRGAGIDHMVMHAQAHLVPWYASFGFRTVGGPFEEAGIPHVTMVSTGGGRGPLAVDPGD